MIKDSNKIAIISGEQKITFSELLEHIHVYAQRLPQIKGQRTLIYAENSTGWVYAFYAVWVNGGIPVPVDASATESDVAYILNDCKPTCIWTNGKKLATVKAALQRVGQEADILLVEDDENAPTSGEKATVAYRGDETALIIYTSGTTGSPKGVMLSFKNILMNIEGVTKHSPIFTTERRTLVLLPLHHVLPLVGTVVIPLYAGGGIAICPTMSAKDIMATLHDAHIGIVIGVPRLWQSLYEGIKRKIDEQWITRCMFQLCEKMNNVKFSRFIFRAVHQKMGGQIRYFVSGGAPLERTIAQGLQTLGLEVLEGYGMTEAAPMIAFTRPGDFIPNCVGLPLPGVESKVIDGEICAKGANIMQGYYNRPEETAEVIDQNGYLHTGDLGHIDEKGHIFITGRRKEIIVLSNGKNVQPAEIEYKLEQYHERVKEAAVVQDGDMLRAIIVPQQPWANNLPDSEVEEALKREVLEPYNRSVTNYKKLMSLFVYRGDLPRTKMEKLQRFKLKDILSGVKMETESAPTDEPQTEEYQILKNYIQNEKKVKILPSHHIETDLAFDSLDMVALEGFIENTFGTQVKGSSIPSFPNIEALAKHIAEAKTRMEVVEENWHQFLNSNKERLKLPKGNFLLPVFRIVSKGFFKVYNRVEVKGVENIPLDHPCIIAPNHQSFLDGPLVTSAMPAQVAKKSFFYAKEDHFKGALLRAMAQNSNIILMERTDLRNSISKLSQVLKDGKNLVIFPEGSRTHTGSVSSFKKSFAILSYELSVPIIPVRITGAYDAWSRSSIFIKPKKITMEFLPAIMAKEEMSYDELAEQVREAISSGIKQK